MPLLDVRATGASATILMDAVESGSSATGSGMTNVMIGASEGSAESSKKYETTGISEVPIESYTAITTTSMAIAAVNVPTIPRSNLKKCNLRSTALRILKRYRAS